MPIDFRGAGKGMQCHNQQVIELFCPSHLSTIKFCAFKTWVIYTISKYQLLSAGLLVKYHSLNGKVVAMRAFSCLK